MRALLGIISGLIISDLLKNTVTSMQGDWPPKSPSVANGLVMLGATFFVTRVLADNLLYYTDRDAATGDSDDDAYTKRVFLIVCDLTSYAFCYAIVLRLVDTGTGRYLGMQTLAWALFYFVVVEALHWWWCRVAIKIVTERKDRAERQRLNLLIRWRRLSRESTALWAIPAAAAFAIPRQPQFVTVPVAAFICALSVASAWRYLSKMRDQYLGLEFCDEDT
ncbi:MAG TPA: hypothetical protein VF883_13040 [Thermoanaerobaculia bacterium]|jgi:cell division protein FtsL